jgi:hypothetical protein
MEREEDLHYRCWSPTQIKLQGHLCWQPTVPQGTTSSLEQLDLCIRKESGELRLCVRSTTEPNSGAIEIIGRVRPSRVGSKRLSRLRRGLSDERLNNNFYPMQSSEVDIVCRGATVHRMTFVIRPGSIHQLNTIQIAEFECINISYEFWAPMFTSLLVISKWWIMN